MTQPRYAAMLGETIVCESDTIDVPFAAVNNSLADRIVDRELKTPRNYGYVKLVPAGEQTYKLNLDAETARRVAVGDFVWADGADDATIVEAKP